MILHGFSRFATNTFVLNGTVKHGKKFSWRNEYVKPDDLEKVVVTFLSTTDLTFIHFYFFEISFPKHCFLNMLSVHIPHRPRTFYKTKRYDENYDVLPNVTNALVGLFNVWFLRKRQLCVQFWFMKSFFIFKRLSCLKRCHWICVNPFW